MDDLDLAILKFVRESKEPVRTKRVMLAVGETSHNKTLARLKWLARFGFISIVAKDGAFYWARYHEWKFE